MHQCHDVISKHRFMARARYRAAERSADGSLRQAGHLTDILQSLIIDVWTALEAEACQLLQPHKLPQALATHLLGYKQSSRPKLGDAAGVMQHPLVADQLVHTWQL